MRARSGITVNRRTVLAAGAGMVALGSIGQRGMRVHAQEASPTAIPDVPDDFKVVLHAAQEQDWIYVLSNLDNLTAEWPNANLRVVVDGSSVYTLASDNDLSAHLGELAGEGVVVHVCPNALKEHKINVSEVPSWALTDLGGVVALVQAMNQGFHYVKP
jgi:intracellular sulfur oxidation DsrE/DsrF family protein